MRIAQSTPWALLDENFLNLERVEAPLLLNLQNHWIGRPEEALFSLIFVFPYQYYMYVLAVFVEGPNRRAPKTNNEHGS